MDSVMDDLFDNRPKQLGLDMFDDAGPASELPDPEEIRQRLKATLALAQSAQDGCPWDARTFKFHKVVFPQMANWLPDDEANQLRFEFAREVKRIELLMAA
jgi:hypothetical protein